MLTRLALDPTLAASCRLLSQGMLRQGRSLTTKSSLRTRTSSHASRSNFSSVWAAPVVGCYAVGVNLTTQCQAEGHKLVMYPTRRRFQRPVVVRPPSWWDTVQRYWRMWMRLWKLAFHLAPVVAFYPILLAKARQEKPEHADAHEYVLLSQDQKDAARHADWWLGWYLKLCLSCVESSGAAVIKLMQWAGSRPDLFGHDFCAVFSQLQDATTPHPWSHTEQALAQAYGSEWRERMQVGELLGSGCIGQVYKGNVKATPESDWNEVAVKVLHPNVRADIDADLDLMRVVARMSKWVPLLHTLKWLDVEGVVEEFADLLQLQLDLRHEAENLKRFGENFRKDPSVVFPEVVEGFVPTRHVLVESFCDGIPVLQFAREHQDQPEKLSQMCMTAIRAICQMIFLDNFMHGDLHPGNVFVSRDGKKFILLDVGIVAEYAEHDHDIIVDILASFIRKQGRKAGRLMIDDSNRRLKESEMVEEALEEERFIDKIEHLTIKASGGDYLMENLGTYISYICNAAATHHVMMNPCFVSAALAVKVQEGIALALDPSIEIWKVATPIIIESERKRGIVQSVSRVLGWEDYVPAWLKPTPKEEAK